VSRRWSRFAPALVVSLGGGLLLWALPAQARPLVYVSEKHSNDAVVIDGASNTVVAHIGVGTSPSGVAVSPDGRSVYVVNASDHANSVSVVDTSEGRAVDTIGVGREPLGVAFHPNGPTAYVTNTGGGPFR
jgi:YVTN family beta-propeller protein